MKIILKVDGGIGKNIAATAVCKAIKKQYPADELIVITAYPDVYIGNPDIDLKLGINDLAYFYQHHIEGQEVKVFIHNPYLETDFINGNSHLIKIWCEMFDIAYNGELPELYINERELNFYSNFYKSDKPILLIQTNGGEQNQPNKYSWSRDLPHTTAQRIVNQFVREYNVVHIRRDDQPALQNVSTVSNSDFRSLAVLIALSDKRLFIDSFAQHAAAALGKPSVVCWIANSPSQFGYDMHTNVLSFSPTQKSEMRYAVYQQYDITGKPYEFPYSSESEIFDTHRIIEALRLNQLPIKLPTPVDLVNIQIRKEVLKGFNNFEMVANRLVWLLGRVDLGNVNCILDIGSWHLMQSIELAKFFPNAQIHAFEPVPESYKLCIDNHKQLPASIRKNITISNVALSNAPGTIPFYEIEKSQNKGYDMGFSSMFKFKSDFEPTGFTSETIQNEILVKADTLDNWCEEHNVHQVDIIWMDVQGAELLVLQGGSRMLKNTRIIMTEVGLKPYYEGHTLKADIDALLFNHGFEELEDSFELNGFDYEANTIYIQKTS